MRLDRNIPRRMRLDVLDQQGHDLLRHAPFGLQEELALPSDLFGVPLGPLQIGLPLDDDLQLVRPPVAVGRGGCWSLGERQTQSKYPLKGCDPEVSRNILSPCPLSAEVKGPNG